MCSAAGGRRCSWDGGSFIRGEVFGIRGLDARPQASMHDLERQHKGKLKGSAASTHDLERQLVSTAYAKDPSSGVQSTFTMVSPTSAVCQMQASTSDLDRKAKEAFIVDEFVLAAKIYTQDIVVFLTWRAPQVSG